MDFNIDVRKKQLESLNQYISSSKYKVQGLLNRMGWNAKKLLTEPEKSVINCSINPEHVIATSTADEHLKKCYIKTHGYDLNEKFLSEPRDIPSTSSIKLDQAKKIEVLSQAHWTNPLFKAAWNGHDIDPMTSERLITTYSPDERLAIYDFCVANTKNPTVPDEFNVLSSEKQDDGKELTYEELLARERDSKRRRIKYKSVHTNRKSHTEVIREVIENQMDVYKMWVSDKTEDSKNCSMDSKTTNEKPEQPERPNSSISKHSNHSGSSRDRSKRADEKQQRNGVIRSEDNYDRRRRSYESRGNGRNRSRSRSRDRKSRDRRRSRSSDRRRNSRDRRSRTYKDRRD